MNAEHSRQLLLAKGLSTLDEETLLERQEAAVVSVRVDPGVRGAVLTARVLLTTLRRLPGKLVLDRTGLSDEIVVLLSDAVDAIDSERSLEVVTRPVEATVALDIGLAGEPGFIRVVPDGHGVQLCADAARVIEIARPPTALGSVFAAAVGACEAFKRIVVDQDDRRSLHDYFRFCPVALTDDVTKAPSLPDDVVDVAIAGIGAIGTAITLIIAELALGGRVIVCDPENFARENKGTYTLGGEAEVQAQPPKVDVAAEVLEAAGYKVEKVEGPSAELIARVDDGELRAPRIVLAGLDSAAARRETQKLFPDHLIDGATGDTAVGVHHGVPDGPCLICFFPEERESHDRVAALAEMLGLSPERLARGDEPLTEADVEAAPPEKRERLRRFIGRPVCGLADASGLTTATTDGYMPSVPFVSQLAACLVVGRLIAVMSDATDSLTPNFFQFDALHGPVSSGEVRLPLSDCFCQTRAGVVAQARRIRYASEL